MSITDREILTRRIRDAVDIVEVVSGYVRLSRSGASFKGLCPFHEEKTPSFLVHPIQQFFKCHGCGVGGDVYKFIQLKEKIDFVEARRMLAERANIDIEQESGRGKSGPGKTDLVSANQWAQQVFRRYYQGAQGEMAQAYVAKRGISPAMAEAFGIGLAIDSFDALIRQGTQAKSDLRVLVAAGLIKEGPRGGYYDTFRNRLMFPIHDPAGRIIAFGGRTLGDDPAKYLNTPATALFDKSANLFGMDRAKEAISREGRAIVVEGYTDCIMAHQFGFEETVATLGTAMTDAHATLLRRYAERVVLLFDSDAAGQRAADRGLSVAILGGLDVILTRVPQGKDPCDYLLSAGRAGFENVLKEGVPALEFKWRQVAQQYEAGETGPSRRRAVEAFLADLAGWLERGSLNPIQKGFWVNQLSKLLSLPAEELHQHLSRVAGASGHRSMPRANNSSTEKGSQSPSPGGEQEAFRQIIEVLLNEPGLFSEVGAALNPALIQDPALSALARELLDLLGAEEAFRIVDLIGRFESPGFGELITDLAERGERRGKYADTIQGALACVQASRADRAALALTRQVRSGREQVPVPGSGGVPQGEDERLRALAPSTSQPHFAPLKARRQALE